MKSILYKASRIIFYSLLGLLITINLFILLSGRFYLYKGLVNTYLVGETGPTIYDKDLFDFTVIQKKTTPLKTTYHSNYNQYALNTEEESFIRELETKALLVYKGNTLIFEQYWGEHSESTVSNSFSMAKTVVAILVSIAIDEGHIKSLDEPVANYLQEFKADKKNEITIKHLLQMASGLDWTESGKNPFSSNAESYYGADLRRLVVNQSVINKPGEIFKYQSGNTQLLAYVLEAATKTDLSKYAEEKLWQKIGAENNAFWSLDKKGGDEKAFCCLYAAAKDFGKLGQLMLNEGRLNEEQIIPLWFYKEMLKPTSLTTEEGIPNSRYGLHVWTYQDKAGLVNYYRGVNSQSIISLPSEDLLIVRVGNKRLPKVTLKDYKKNPKEISKEQIGHSFDLFEYLRIGKKITAKTTKVDA